MLSPLFSVLLVPMLAAAFLAATMGASGTAPSFSAAFGADLVRRERIAGLFGLFVLFGALLAGKKVVQTLGGGILPGEVMSLVLTTIILVSVGLSILAATLLGVPQSTSQSTVLALVGPALYFGNLESGRLLLEILPTWFLLPLVAFGVTWGIARLLREPLRAELEDLGTGPGPRLRQALVMGASCYVAFAIGSNNVANAAGPIASMLFNEFHLRPDGQNSVLVMLLATLVVAPWFGIGSSLWGSRVLGTLGKEITGLGPLGATVVSLVTATLLLLASMSRGVPTSLVQLNAGAILAVGIVQAGGREVLARSSVRRLAVVWVVAPLIAFLLALGLTWGADLLGLLPRP